MTTLEKVINIFKKSKGKIRPPVVVSGPTGSGKTWNTNLLTEKYEIPMIKINAAQLTKEGYTGMSLSKALVPLKKIGHKLNIVYVDEFCKLFLSSDDGGVPSDITIGVQNEFLDLLEAKTTRVMGDYGKYDIVKLENTLFIFSGAFNDTPINNEKDLMTFGVKREFLGRIAVYMTYEAMSLEDMLGLVDKSELLELYAGIQGKKKLEARRIIKDTITKHYEENFLGTRLINNIIHRYFLEIKDVEKEEKTWGEYYV